MTGKAILLFFTDVPYKFAASNVTAINSINEVLFWPGDGHVLKLIMRCPVIRIITDANVDFVSVIRAALRHKITDRTGVNWRGELLALKYKYIPRCARHFIFQDEILCQLYEVLFSGH